MSLGDLLDEAQAKSLTPGYRALGIVDALERLAYPYYSDAIWYLTQMRRVEADPRGA
jgi:hypothetical protein